MVSVASGAETPARPDSLWLRWRALLLRHEWIRGYLLLSPTALVMVTMLIVPIMGLFLLSFWTQEYFEIHRDFTVGNYLKVLNVADNPIYGLLLLKSIRMSLTATIVVVVLAYPMAYYLAFRVTKNKLMWIILITVPFWTSYLLRIFAWKVVLGYNGVVNSALIGLGITAEPIDALLYNPFAVIVTLTHAWMPFVVLPIYVSLAKIPRELLVTAADLGDGPFARFRRIVLPLSMPGVIAGAMLVFIPTVGDYVAPMLVGGTQGAMIGTVIAAQFGPANNWPLASAISVVAMAAVSLSALLLMVGLTQIRRRAA